MASLSLLRVTLASAALRFESPPSQRLEPQIRPGRTPRRASSSRERLFAVEGVVRSTRRWPGRGRGLPRMGVTMISGSKCSGSGWSPIGRFSGAGLSSPTDGVVAAGALARSGTRWSGGWRTSRSGGGPRCWRSASADTVVTPPPTTRNTDRRRAASRQSPTLPSIISRRMSAWPACRAVSTITCRYIHVSSLPRGVVTA